MKSILRSHPVFLRFIPCCRIVFFLQILTQPLAAQFRIDPDLAPNPLEKPGYHLIFSDEFSVFDSTVWNRSSPGNDEYNYGHPMLCFSLNARHAPKNPSNVLPPDLDGHLPLRIREGEEQNACSHSSSEIKSFQNMYPSPDFRGWKVYPNCYVEVRAKVPDCRGLGAGLWLYGPSQDNYCEIDFLELYGDEPDAFQTNFIYGPHGSTLMDQDKVRLRDMKGNKINLGHHFLTYAVEFDADSRIDMYVNNQWVSWKDQYWDRDGYFDPRKHVQPFDLRISTGSTSLSGGDVTLCNDLPDYLYVDHVRIYLKEGHKAVQVFDKTQTKLELCSDFFWGDGKGYGVTYYPGAEYTWSAHPGINILDYEDDPGVRGNDNWQFYWISIDPGTTPGTYSQTLSVRFPGGYTETLPLKVTVNSGGAPAPVPEELVPLALLDGTIAVAVLKQPGTSGYEWSTGDGNWRYVNNARDSLDWNIFPLFFPLKLESYAQEICIRAKTVCHTSEQKCVTLTIPAFGEHCQSCLPAPTIPETIQYIRVVNALGQLVLQTQPILEMEEQVPDGLPRGMYVIQYLDGIGRVVRTRKVVVLSQY
ncbi:MAG: family 16 glycosylhydrolase [Saprospiraceae bacterium]|jgi:hypothetical protein|nr:family 16 glycosylhydrolase [Saprospiraceae bacterium]